jgi:hypothetical protein
MKGVAAALTLLLAIPVALASSIFGEDLPGIVIHIALGAGSVLFAAAVFDFGLPRWVNWIGAASGAALGAIFLLQALSLMIPGAGLDGVVFGILGQEPERYLPLGILAWFVALLLAGSLGMTRLIGWVVMPVVVGLEVASFAGMIIGIDVPNLKILFLAPFVWLLIESAQRGLVGSVRVGTQTGQIADGATA